MDSLNEAGKKTPVNNQELQRQRNKCLRIAGKEHVNTKGELVEARKPGPDCKCRRKCYEKIDDKSRAKLFKAFYSLKSYDEQNAYLYALIKKIPIKRKTSHTSTKRTCTFQYFIKVNGEETQVCLTALENIHGISGPKIRHLCIKLGQNVIFPRDERGHQKPRAPKVSEETVNLVKTHIYSIIRTERARMFLKDEKANNGPDLNMAWMHKDFMDTHDPTYAQKLLEFEKIHGPTEPENHGMKNMFHNPNQTWGSSSHGQNPPGSNIEPGSIDQKSKADQPAATEDSGRSNNPIRKRKKRPKGMPEPLVMYWFYSRVFHKIYTLKEANTLRKKVMEWRNSEEFVPPKAVKRPRTSKPQSAPARKRNAQASAPSSSGDMYGAYPKILHDISRLESQVMPHFQGESSFNNDQRIYRPLV